MSKSWCLSSGREQENQWLKYNVRSVCTRLSYGSLEQVDSVPFNSCYLPYRIDVSLSNTCFLAYEDGKNLLRKSFLLTFFSNPPLVWHMYICVFLF